MPDRIAQIVFLLTASAAFATHGCAKSHQDEHARQLATRVSSVAGFMLGGIRRGGASTGAGDDANQSKGVSDIQSGSANTGTATNRVIT